MPALSPMVSATQTVFGEGPVPAAMISSASSRATKEDLIGRPFIAPGR
jgi:hypothetical protein